MQNNSVFTLELFGHIDEILLIDIDWVYTETEFQSDPFWPMVACLLVLAVVGGSNKVSSLMCLWATGTVSFSYIG